MRALYNFPPSLKFYSVLGLTALTYRSDSPLLLSEDVFLTLTVRLSGLLSDQPIYGRGCRSRTHARRVGACCATVTLILYIWYSVRDSNSRQNGYEPLVLTTELTECIGDSERIRTPDPLLRRQLLYPTELRNQ